MPLTPTLVGDPLVAVVQAQVVEQLEAEEQHRGDDDRLVVAEALQAEEEQAADEQLQGDAHDRYLPEPRYRQKRRCVQRRPRQTGHPTMKSQMRRGVVIRASRPGR